MKINLLRGNSGCKIYKVNILHKEFVIKISSRASFNNTLKCQKEKQQTYSKIFKTPKVFISGYLPHNCKYFILMEYICGSKLSDIIFLYNYNYGKKILNNFFNVYITNIKFNFSNNFISNNFIFINKIENVAMKLEKFNFSNNEKLIINKTINILKKYDWSYIQKSESHGDLTLENVIYDNSNKFVLIDFLNGFYESWELDVSKLLFDIRTGWSLRYNYILIDNTKIIRKKFYKITMKIVINNIEEKYRCKVKKDLLYLQLLHAIRILPYSKDNMSKDIIFWGLKDIIKEL